jgi:4-amino-4-deoxy-L-arabinose transferase-like glycosyltransferase
MKIIQKHFILIVVLCIAFLLRSIYLDRIPVAIGGDELTYALTTKAMTVAWTDMTGKWNPWSAFIFQYPPDQQQSELPYFTNFPSIFFLSLTLLSTRIANVLFSVGTVFLLYLIAKHLWNKEAGLIASAMAAINPWAIYTGRTMYEMTTSAFFILLGWYLLLVLKGRSILLAIPIFFLAFYSYIATKVVILPFILLSCIYIYQIRKNKKEAKYYIAVSAVMAVFIAIFITLMVVSPHSTRISEVVTPASPEIAGIVNQIRKVSIRSPLVDIFENKYVLFTKILATKVLRSFSPELLFVKGDLFYSIYNHGLFYLVDAIFFIFGIAFLWAQKRRLAIYLVLLSIISAAPHAIHGASVEDFTPHLALFVPLLVLIISFGIVGVLTSVGRKLKTSVLFLLIGVYILSVFNFAQVYFFQFPIQGNFNFPLRILSRYIQLSNSSQHVVLYTQSAKDIFRKYLFYSDGIQKSTLHSVALALDNDEVVFGNMRILGCSDKPVDTTEATVIIDANCDSKMASGGSIKIPLLKDGGTAFALYNDIVCNAFNLKPYPSLFTIEQLDVEHLTTQEFCENYITR